MELSFQLCCDDAIEEKIDFIVEYFESLKRIKYEMKITSSMKILNF